MDQQAHDRDRRTEGIVSSCLTGLDRFRRPAHSVSHRQPSLPDLDSSSHGHCCIECDPVRAGWYSCLTSDSVSVVSNRRVATSSGVTESSASSEFPILMVRSCARDLGEWQQTLRSRHNASERHPVDRLLLRRRWVCTVRRRPAEARLTRYSNSSPLSFHGHGHSVSVRTPVGSVPALVEQSPLMPEHLVVRPPPRRRTHSPSHIHPINAHAMNRDDLAAK
jgi:hypothetical protein